MKVVVNKTWRKVVTMQYKEGALYVTANMFLSRKRLKEIIKENSDWINNQKKAATEQAKKAAPEEVPANHHGSVCDKEFDQQQIVKDIFAGRKTMVLGDIISIEPSASSKTYLDGNTLYIGEKYYNSRELRIKAIKSYLKKIAFLFVASEVSSFGSSVSLCPQKIEFKDTGDCWCKCALASQKSLCFDFRITQLPQNLRYYVIAHAFAHFRFTAHDDAFWNHVSNIIPHYADLDKQLSAYDFLKDI